MDIHGLKEGRPFLFPSQDLESRALHPGGGSKKSAEGQECYLEDVKVHLIAKNGETQSAG